MLVVNFQKLNPCQQSRRILRPSVWLGVVCCAGSDCGGQITLLSARGGRWWWWRSKLEWWVPHQAHHRLGRVKLLGHQRLGTWRRWGLPHSAPPRARAGPGAAVLAAAAAAVLVLVVRVGAGAIAASCISATAISVRRGRRGGAVSVPAASSTAISAIVAVAVLGAAAYRTYSPVTLVLVHQVGIVRVRATTETGSTAWK